MTVPLVDGAAVAEFLDRAEPFLPPDVSSDLSQRLKERRDRLRHSIVRGAALDACWQAPATRRRRDIDDVWQERAAETWPLITAGDRDLLFGLLEAWEPVPAWFLDWATFWLTIVHPTDGTWWTRWLYSREQRTGALPLVLVEPEALAAETLSATYGRIEEGGRFLGELLASTRRLQAVAAEDRALVALASVYAVYLFTVTAWRMTREFTTLLPPFGRVVGWLLGIQEEVRAVAREGEGD